jgi:hypothetical protein
MLFPDRGNSEDYPFWNAEAAPDGTAAAVADSRPDRRCQSGQLRLKLGRAFIRAHHAFKCGKPSAIE